MKSKRTKDSVSRERELIKREDYRVAFIKRNVKKWNEFRERFQTTFHTYPDRNPTDEEFKVNRTLAEEFKTYFPSSWWWFLRDGTDLESVKYQVSPLSIRLFSDEEYDYLHYESNEDTFNRIVSERKVNSQRNRFNSPSLAIDAVNLDGNTIAIEIYLDRKKEDILRDVGFLLDVLHREAEYFHVDLGRPKKPQWDVYDKYLQVYDLRKANPKMSWADIAIEVFPEETIKNTAYKRKPKRDLIPQQSATDKVKHYWKEANKMINEGGWKKI